MNPSLSFPSCLAGCARWRREKGEGERKEGEREDRTLTLERNTHRTFEVSILFCLSGLWSLSLLLFPSLSLFFSLPPSLFSLVFFEGRRAIKERDGKIASLLVCIRHKSSSCSSLSLSVSTFSLSLILSPFNFFHPSLPFSPVHKVSKKSIFLSLSLAHFSIFF